MIYSVCKLQYASNLVREEKGNDLERISKPLSGDKAKSLSPKQSVMFRCKIWLEITRKFSKCLDVRSL